ncbi:alkaline phosphatase family protein [soil metagenome]
MGKRAVVIGLDGASWHLLDPMIEAGVMPRLGALRDKGAHGLLASTIPTYTPPAWTSAVTGVNPGRHGIYGFFEGNAQSERQVLVHSGKVKAPTLWEMTEAQGATAGIYNLPLTYPPPQVAGWMISGMMTPERGEHRLTGFGRPHAIEAKVLAVEPDYVVDVSADWEADYKTTALCDRIGRSLRQRFSVLETLLEEDPTDIVFTVLEAPDRLQHVYHGYLDPADELYGSPQGVAMRPRILDCYAAMDRICGLLEDWAGPDGGVIVCSDHGFTAWEASVHTNALLQQWGLLTMKRSARALQTSLARSLVPAAKRFLPHRVARRAKGATFSGIDWARTRAFASPVPQQGVFVNLAGREPNGHVPEHELGAVKAEIKKRFASLRGPDGHPVTDEVHLSEEIFHGDALDGAPDVLPVLRGHRYELDDEVFHRQPFTDVAHLPRGVHHPEGIVVLAGPGVDKGPGSREPLGSVMDVTPTLLYLAGLGVPGGLDGGVVTSVFSEAHLKANPVDTLPPLSSGVRDESSPYSKEEEAAIEESLRGLGYL